MENILYFTGTEDTTIVPAAPARSGMGAPGSDIWNLAYTWPILGLAHQAMFCT